jgi:hypothetical protein
LAELAAITLRLALPRAVLERDHAALVDEAAESSITLPHLEITEMRRRRTAYEEAQRREQVERDARANAASVRRRG